MISRIKSLIVGLAQRMNRDGPWTARVVFALCVISPILWLTMTGLAGLAGYYFFEVRPIEQRVAQTHQAASDLSRLANFGHSQAQEPAAQLASFYAAVPTPADIPDALQTLFDVMQEEGLMQEQASFELVRSSTDRFVRYEISLPFKATYPQLRRFLAKTIAALPTLAVNDLQFSRSQVSDALVDCRLSLTLYLIDRPGSR